MDKLKVFTLAYCRNEELLPATLMVFDTLRVGFPAADVIVFDNANSELVRSQLREKCKKAKTQFVHLQEQVSHHQWIENLVSAAMGEEKAEPFYLMDTDVVFWDNFERWTPEFKGQPLAGRLLPGFPCGFTHCWTHPRLHTSLLYIDPSRLKAAIETFKADYPQTPWNPLVNLFAPVHIPPREFYDTCAMLYRVAGTCAPFEPKHLDCYDHLFCGTVSDIVAPHLGDGKMMERHKAIFAKPALARGMWREQDQYFQKQGLIAQRSV